MSFRIAPANIAACRWSRSLGETLQQTGVRTRGMTANEVVQLALRNAGPHGTSDFPMILANVAGKRLRQAYTTAPRTFDRWTRGITTTDFKPLFPTQIGNFLRPCCR